MLAIWGLRCVFEVDVFGVLRFRVAPTGVGLGFRKMPSFQAQPSTIEA